MNDDSILGATLGQLGQTVKQAAKQIVKIPQEMGADLGGQIGGAKQTEQKPQEQKQGDWKSDEERVKFLKDLYGPFKSPENKSDKAKQPVDQTSANPLATAVENKKASEFQEQIKDKSPEEQKKLMELRNQLHKENYYDPTFNPVKKQEERPVEKIEKEKKMEALELEEKNKKKPPPLAIVREQNKAEQFRGAAG